MRRPPNPAEQLLKSSAAGEPTKLEVAHVLFTDIVGYSQLPMDEQTAVVQRLNRLVRETGEFARAEACEQLISLPTGDGMALVFFEDAESALRCAVELSRSLRAAPDFKLRMGVHTGPVYRVDDINTNMNVAGDGINTAQRVMDCGDAGHILVSGQAAGMFCHLKTWAAYMHDLGEAEVKHGVRVRIFNVYSDEYGNAAVPEKLCHARSTSARPSQSTAAKGGALSGRRVARPVNNAGAPASAGEKASRIGLHGKRAARGTATPGAASSVSTKTEGGMLELPPVASETPRSDADDSAAKGRKVDRRRDDQRTPETPPAQPVATARGTDRRYHILVAAILLVALVAAGVSYYGVPFVDEKTARTIAIIPFSHEKGDDAIEYFSDGIAEELIGSLTQLKNLTVMSRDSAFRFKGVPLDVKTIGRQLDVQAVLVGHVTQHGNELRLHVALVDVETGANLWSRSYLRQMSNIATLNSEVALDVTEVMRLNLSGEDERKLAENGTDDSEAYKLYLQGRAQWNLRTGDGLKRAAEYYKQAVEKDPEYARAYAGLAETYVLFPLFGVTRPKDSMPFSKAAALRALEIKRHDSLAKAKAHVALGAYLANYAWNHPASAKEFRRAIEINPKYETAHHWLGNMPLQAMGKFDESIAAGRVAEKLDPLSTIISADTAQNLFFARRYDEAIEHFQRALVLDPNFSYTRYYLAATYHAKGMYAEAIDEYRKSLALNNAPYVKALLARSLVKAGRRDEAVRILDELKSDSKSRYVQSVAFALVHGALGEMTEAFAWLEKDLVERSYYPAYYEVDPTYDELRGDSRFAELVRRVAQAKSD